MSTAISFALWLLVMLGIFLAVWHFTAQRNQAFNECWSQVAQQLGGIYSPATFFELGNIAIPRGNNVLRVDVYSTGGKNAVYYTQWTAPWPRPGEYLSVTPEGFFEQVGKMLGFTDYETGDPPFDAAFYVQANDGHLVHQMLTPPVRALLGRLAYQNNHSSLALTIENGVFTIRKREVIYDASELLVCTHAVLALYDAAQGLAIEGVQILEKELNEYAGPARCQVCGESAERDVVLCARCHTPHHRECWRYNGRCSTYGCGEEMYREQEVVRKN